MSVQAIGGVSGSSGSSSDVTQSDFQVKQLESQIKDWSTCPTTPPATKKAIVARLELQLDSLESGLAAKHRETQTENAGSARSGASLLTGSTPTVAPRYVSPFKIDTYV